jgi:hypothetical protein
VDLALPDGSTRDDEIVALDGSIDGEEDGDAAEEEDSQANLQPVGGSPSASSRATRRRAVGTIITGRGNFDTSVTDDVWSDPGAEEDSTREDQTESSQPMVLGPHQTALRRVSLPVLLRALLLRITRPPRKLPAQQFSPPPVRLRQEASVA